jgi:hypothetical protein
LTVFDRWPSCLARIGVCAAIVLLPQFARAQPCGERPPASEPTPDAIAANELALKKAEEQRYVEALALFQKAYDLSPSYVILYNVGRMAALTGDAARAIHAYECHVEEGGGDVSPERKAEVAAEVARLGQEVALLRIEVDEAGASVAVDGVAVGRAPLAKPVTVNPGKHRVTVRGTRSDAREVDLAKGATVALTFDVGPAASPPPDGEPFRFPDALVGTAWVVTGIVSVSAAVTGALALVGSSDLEDDVYLGPNRRPARDSQIAEKAEQTRGLAIATDVLIAIGVVGGSAAISFSIVNAVAGDPADPKQPPAPSAKVLVGPAFVGVGGTF